MLRSTLISSPDLNYDPELLYRFLAGDPAPPSLFMAVNRSFGRLLSSG